MRTLLTLLRCSRRCQQGCGMRYPHLGEVRNGVRVEGVVGRKEPVLTWLRGRQQKAAARCAGRCPCMKWLMEAGDSRVAWQGNCPSTGAASQL